MPHRPIRLLFYGDSNTWGYIRGGTRFPAAVRFPTRAAALINNAIALEAGVNGRNCAFSHPLVEPALLGGATFVDTLTRALPVDALCLMLGTNDMLPPLYRTAEAIAQDLQKIIRLAKATAPSARILLVNPVPINQAWCAELEEEMGAAHALRLEPLAPALARVAQAEEIVFFDAGRLIPEADAGDGVHLSAQAHALLGTAIGTSLARLLEDEHTQSLDSEKV